MSRPHRSTHADHKMRDLLRDFAGALYATPAQAAEELGRSIHTLAKWRKDGNGPPWTRHQNGWGILYCKSRSNNPSLKRPISLAAPEQNCGS